MMPEPKKCLEPQRYYSTQYLTLKASTAVSHLSPNLFLNTFSTVSHLYCLSFLKFHCLMSLHDGRSQKRLEPQRYYSTQYLTLKASTAVSHLSPNIFLNTFSTVSSLYCLSFLKFHCLMSLHDGRTQKLS